MMKEIKMFKKIVATVIIIFAISSYLTAQSVNYNQIAGQEVNNQVNTITTAVPFLMISPDARAGGMGDAGVASDADVNSIHWNPSKLAFVDKTMGIGISYTPWLRELVPDINLAYLSFFYKTKKRGAFGASLRYFSLGSITFTDANGTTIGQFTPNEFAVDAAYGVKLSKTFSAGGAVRYIQSNLTGGAFVDGAATKTARGVGVDVSALWRKDKIRLSKDKFMRSAIGIDVANIGSKMSYSNLETVSDFQPCNLRLGASLTFQLDDFNSISIEVDANKLLVPTPPIYKRDSTGGIVQKNGQDVILLGKNPNVGETQGIIESFYDAPGGSKEEFREINYATGIEYWYNHLFALRAGFFYESPYKGNRKYFTLGAGVKYNVFGLDFAYLIPTQQRNPLENTLRFTLTFDFDAFKAQKDEKATE
jgi:hypothetical protein